MTVVTVMAVEVDRCTKPAPRGILRRLRQPGIHFALTPRGTVDDTRPPSESVPAEFPILIQDTDGWLREVRDEVSMQWEVEYNDAADEEYCGWDGRGRSFRIVWADQRVTLVDLSKEPRLADLEKTLTRYAGLEGLEKDFNPWSAEGSPRDRWRRVLAAAKNRPYWKTSARSGWVRSLLLWGFWAVGVLFGLEAAAAGYVTHATNDLRPIWIRAVWECAVALVALHFASLAAKGWKGRLPGVVGTLLVLYVLSETLQRLR